MKKLDKQVNFQMHTDDYLRAKEKSDQEGKSLSAVIRELLRGWLNVGMVKEKAKYTTRH